MKQAKPKQVQTRKSIRARMVQLNDAFKSSTSDLFETLDDTGLTGHAIRRRWR